MTTGMLSDNTPVATGSPSVSEIACAPSSSTPKPARILAVWTRELDETEQVGRVNVAREIRTALETIGVVANRRLTNAFEEKRRVRSLLHATKAFLSALFSGRPLPLQCALFAAAAARGVFLQEACAADVVYLDGIRALLFIRELNRIAPDLRVVVDLGDLMSRRFDDSESKGIQFSLGYLDTMVPRWVSNLAVTKLVARRIAWYERLTLRNAERELLRYADSIVLLSSVEKKMLEDLGSGIAQSEQAQVVAIPPLAKAARGLPAPRAPLHWHAIFVGSDVLVQNRMTIDYLLQLWSSAHLDIKLHVYGRQKMRWAAVPNVEFCGYIENIAEAYQPNSILVYPCFKPGGIKTKVLEAFSYGVPVVGNTLTFESLPLAGYPLVIDDQAELVALLQNPESRAGDLAHAVAVASSYLRQEHSVGLFNERWRQVVLGSGAS